MWRHCNNQEVFCWQREFALDNPAGLALRHARRNSAGSCNWNARD
jgi:hypothetical protein